MGAATASPPPRLARMAEGIGYREFMCRTAHEQRHMAGPARNRDGLRPVAGEERHRVRLVLQGQSESIPVGSATSHWSRPA